VGALHAIVADSRCALIPLATGGMQVSVDVRQVGLTKNIAARSVSDRCTAIPRLHGDRCCVAGANAIESGSDSNTCGYTACD